VTAPHAVVVGGGLAGLAAGLECADAGASVTLFERRSRLGGATFSIRRNGAWLDNGQHVALRCCTEYLAFLDRLGVGDRLTMQPRLRIPVLAEGGRRATLARVPLPAPLHLGPALLRYRHLSPWERLAALRGAAALRRLDPTDPRLDEQAFGAWLREHGQSPRAVDALWNLIALPTLNLHADEASLALAAMVFRTGLLDTADACDVAVPAIPLQQLHGDPAAGALERLGARVVTRARVRGIDASAAAVTVRLEDAVVTADAVVVAVPHHEASEILPEGTLPREVAAGLGDSPIVNLHLHFDRAVLTEPFAAAVGSPLQWLFDRTDAAGVHRGQLVSVSLSGADDAISEPVEALRTRAVAAIERLLPAARGATLLDFAVTREPRATFRGAPGTGRLRPAQRTQVPRLYLAGAWTDTGWPATMEGAVRSGRAAAHALLEDTGAAAPAWPRRLEAVA
jgi:hydroxysqualene dehydroxylase